MVAPSVALDMWGVCEPNSSLDMKRLLGLLSSEGVTSRFVTEPLTAALRIFEGERVDVYLAPRSVSERHDVWLIPKNRTMKPSTLSDEALKEFLELAQRVGRLFHEEYGSGGYLLYTEEEMEGPWRMEVLTTPPSLRENEPGHYECDVLSVTERNDHVLLGDRATYETWLEEGEVERLRGMFLSHLYDPKGRLISADEPYFVRWERSAEARQRMFTRLVSDLQRMGVVRESNIEKRVVEPEVTPSLKEGCAFCDQKKVEWQRLTTAEEQRGVYILCAPAPAERVDGHPAEFLLVPLKHNCEWVLDARLAV